MRRDPRLLLICLILIAAFALRVRGLSSMLDIVHYDEAYYAVDALSVLENPRLQPFFDGNFGREGLWMYALTPALRIFGGSALAIRITAIFTGVLTVAAVYRLALELTRLRWTRRNGRDDQTVEPGAWWLKLYAGIGTFPLYAAATLAVLYWHVQMSHIGFRALLMPLVGAMAFAALLAARRRDQMRNWLIAGVWSGLLAYTYIAARAWLPLLGVLLLVFWLRGYRRAWIAAVTAGIVALPLMIYIVQNPAAANQRIDQVAVDGLDQVVANFSAWIPVWFTAGPTDVVYNLPGRPLLNGIFAFLVVAGGLTLLLSRSILRAVVLPLTLLLVALLFAAALAPALVTSEPLRWLRAIGIVMPVALVIGLCTEAYHRVFWRLSQRLGMSIELAILTVGLFIVVGGTTAQQFDEWVGSPDLYQPMEQGLYAGIDRMAELAPDDAPVYFAPFTVEHPVIRLRRHALGEREVGAFIPVECVALSREGYVFGLTAFTPGMLTRLAEFAMIETVASDAQNPPRWTISRVTADDDLFSGDWNDFGGVLAARALDLPDELARRGEPFTVTMLMRRNGEIDRGYTLFVHLYDESAGETRLVGQVDQPLCLSHPPVRWRPDEVVIQPFTLTITADLVAGTYMLAYGIYESPDGARLPVGESDVVRIGSIRIE